MTRVVYVVAHAYSGTTLLSLLLGSHPEVATVGEMSGIAEGVDVATYPCSCGEPIRSCPFWSEVRRGMAARGHRFELEDFGLRFRALPAGGPADRLLRAGVHGRAAEAAREAALRAVPGWGRARERILARNAAFIDTVAEITGRPVFVDISKRPGRALHLRRVPGIGLRVLHMVRDVRAVTWSCGKNLGMTPESAARSWRGLQREAERLRRLFPAGHWRVLRHEDLCARPEETLRGLHAWMGVEPAFPPQASAVSHVIGNRMRLAGAGAIRLDDRWRGALPDPVQAACLRAAGGLHARYGYGA